MPKVNLLNLKGEKSGTISLPDYIFAAEIKPQLMAQAVRVYLSNQRLVHPIAKTRSEVKRTKAKWYRQKGTGRARHGARSAPIFVGGGVSHGPRGNQNYKMSLSKKMARAALFSALTSKLKAKEVLVIKGLDKIEPKTKVMNKVLVNLGLNTKKKANKILLVLPKTLTEVIRSARNIKSLNYVQADSINTYGILNTNRVVFMEESISRLKECFLKK